MEEEDTSIHNLTARSFEDLLEMSKLTDVNGMKLRLRNQTIPADRWNELEQLFSRLEFLEICTLGSAKITDTGLVNILQKTRNQLKDLKLAKLGVTGYGLAGLQLPHLEKLALLLCSEVTETGFGNLVQMSGSELKEFQLGGSKVTGDALEGLGVQFPQLEILGLRNCGKLTETGLVNILQMSGSQLKEFDLAGSKVQSLEALGGLALQFPELEILRLQNCSELTETGLVNLLQMSTNKLKALKLSSNGKVTGDGLRGLARQFPDLECLGLQNCSKLTESGLVNMLKMSGSKLKELSLAGNQLTGDELEELALQFPHLEVLGLHSCSKLTETGLINILQMCGEQLKDLQLAGSKVTGEALGGLADKFPHLKILGLQNCSQVTETGLVNLLLMSGREIQELYLAGNQLTGDKLKGLGVGVQLHRLEVLGLQHCTELTDTGLVTMLQVCGDKLRDLNLSHCLQLSEEGLRELMRIPGGQLKNLDCSYIPNMSSSLKEEIKEHFPGCNIVF